MEINIAVFHITDMLPENLPLKKYTLAVCCMYMYFASIQDIETMSSRRLITFLFINTIRKHFTYILLSSMCICNSSVVLK